MKKRFSVIALLGALTMMGCQSSGEVISGQFSDMGAIAVQYHDNCDVMGTELIQYLSEHETALRNAVLDTGNAENSEAKEIFRTSLKLHEAMQHCSNESVTTFKQRLSKIVLQPSEI